MVNAQTWLDENYALKDEIIELDVSKKGLENSLNLNDFVKLRVLKCGNNKLTGLNVSGLVKLEVIECSNNLLTSESLRLSGLSRLETFLGKHNLFENLDFFKSPENLRHLDLTDNNFHKRETTLEKESVGLDIFSNFVNLESLKIGNYSRETKNGKYNRFCGSLEHLSELKNLKKLDINWTNVDNGLRYLPLNLEKIWCCDKYKGYGSFESKSSKLVKKLKNFHTNQDNEYNYQAWRKDYDEQKNLMEKNKIYPQLTWRENINKTTLSKEKSPIRFYNIKTDEVEGAKETSVIEKYAIVSYSWGVPGKPDDIDGWTTKHKLTPNGHKSLYKALQACKILKEVGLEINYLWSSEICIDQNNLKEEAEEVSKMRYYYNNTNVTLIAIHTELLEELSSSRFPKEGKSEQLLLDWPSIIKIVTDSDWFTRAWTYQEGWLSKQTIFMFDDLLIDGRFLAAVWSFNNPSHARYSRYNNLKEFYDHSRKIATPFGWTYYQGDYNSQDIVVLRLDEALRETKNRKRDIPVDAIYSILGLLPYGDKVEVKYKSRMCPECPNQEEVETCQHEEKNKNQPIYTKNDVESILIEVMKVAVQNGYGEPFAWFGPGSDTYGRCWLPKVLEFSGEEAGWEQRQTNGSVDVRGGMDIKYIMPKNKQIGKKFLDEIFTEDGIKTSGSIYKIISFEKSIDRIESGSTVDGELHRREINVAKWGDYSCTSTKISLWGVQESLGKIKTNNVFLIVIGDGWKSKHGEAPAILASYDEQNDCFHRIDLVSLGEGAERLEKGEKREVIIGTNSKLINKYSEYEYQAQVEISNSIKENNLIIF